MDGNIIHDLNLTGPFILFRLFIDAFGTNSALGSSASKDKIVGFYYSLLSDIEVCALRSTIQTIALLDSKDISQFGLSKCLEKPINDLKELVVNGFYDEQRDITLQVRVISCLGDNLGQNEA